MLFISNSYLFYLQQAAQIGVQKSRITRPLSRRGRPQKSAMNGPRLELRHLPPENFATVDGGPHSSQTPRYHRRCLRRDTINVMYKNLGSL